MEESTGINLGPLDDIPVGQGLCFVLNDEEIAIFRSRKGQVSAIGNRCPHKGGSLANGIIGEGKVVCPLHGHKFDLKTGQAYGAHECVRVFHAWIEDGNVLIEYTRLSINSTVKSLI